MRLSALLMMASGITFATQASGSVTESQCLSEAVNAFGTKVTATRGLQVGTWDGVPPGCSVQSGGDWAAHFNHGWSTTTHNWYTQVAPNNIPQSECLSEAVKAFGAKVTATRGFQVGHWNNVPAGCSVQGAEGQPGDWSAHYNTNPDGVNDGWYIRVVDMKLHTDAPTTAPTVATYTKQANTGCGYTSGDTGDCGTQAEMYAYTSSGDKFILGISRDNVEACMEACDAIPECAGFAYAGDQTKCALRTSVTCGVGSNTQRDCYTKIQTADPTSVPTAAPTGSPTASHVDTATVLSYGSGSFVGVAGDSVYHCSDAHDGCLVNSLATRSKWIRVDEVPTQAVDSMQPFDSFTASTSDGAWSTEQGAILFRNEVDQYAQKFPVSCDCQSGNKD